MKRIVSLILQYLAISIRGRSRRKSAGDNQHKEDRCDNPTHFSEIAGMSKL
jgi:hypothetical protein